MKPDRIGVLGASAGGHLAACASELWDSPEGSTGAKLDEVSARPDFAILIYPVITMADPFVHKGSRTALLGKTPSPELIEQLSLEKHVRKDSPPVFIAATMADKTVPVENSLKFYQALRDAASLPKCMSTRRVRTETASIRSPGPTAEWPARVEEWMRFNGWIPKAGE